MGPDGWRFLGKKWFWGVFHILDLGYENFLSIGSDFDGADMDKRLYDITAVPALYNYLKSRNIGENILKKIFFENAYNFYTKTKGEQKQWIM